MKMISTVQHLREILWTYFTQENSYLKPWKLVHIDLLSLYIDLKIQCHTCGAIIIKEHILALLF